MGERRWIDKALVGAIGVVLALVGVVWAKLQADVHAVDGTQRQHSERITITETEMKALRTDVQEVKSDVKLILREVKK